MVFIISLFLNNFYDKIIKLLCNMKMIILTPIIYGRTEL